MLKHRNYNSRPYALQCFIRWVEDIEESITNQKTIHCSPMNWHLIELDLRRCAQYRNLKQTIWFTEPLEMESFSSQYVYEQELQKYESYKTKNAVSFFGKESIIHYILQSLHSPLLLLYEFEYLYGFGCDPRRLHSVPIAMDAVHILKLLIQCNIVYGDEAFRLFNDRIITLSQKLKREFYDIFREVHIPQIIEQYIDIIVLLDDNEVNVTESGLIQIYDGELEEETNSLMYRCFGDEKHCILSNNLLEPLLFRGIKPFQFRDSNAEQWFQEFQKQFKINCHSSNIEALVAPFVMYPYFEKTKQNLVEILCKCIPMFHDDCIYVIVSYLFMDDLFYSRCYHQYKNNIDIKCAEFLVYLRLMDTEIQNRMDKRIQNRIERNIFDRKYGDAHFLKYVLHHFEENIIQKMDMMYLYKLLMKYKLFDIHCIQFHYTFLLRIITNCLKRKKYKVEYYKLFERYMNKLDDLCVKEVLNCWNKSERIKYTLLIEAVVLCKKRRKCDTLYRIIQYLLNHKCMDVNSNTNSKAFYHALSVGNGRIITLFVNNNKLSIETLCKATLDCLYQQRIRFGHFGAGQIPKVKSTLLRRLNQGVTTRESKLIRKTVRKIGKWLVHGAYFYRYCKYDDVVKCL